MESEPENKFKNKNNFRYLKYLGLGSQLAATVLVTVFLGLWLDKKLNTSPFLTIVLSLLGVFSALYNFIKTVTELENDKNK